VASFSILSGNTNLGASLQELLLSDEIVPGADPSYQLCKTIYLYHPVGARLAEAPIKIAQSQGREITVPNSPEDRVVRAFKDEWTKIKADDHIANVMSQSRVYGIASVAALMEGTDTEKPLDYKRLWDKPVSFNVFDPLNTSGSLVLNQNPNDMDFQHVVSIASGGKRYHRSRTCVMLNERPIYIAYTTAAFGYVGRSCYQRALFPLKSFVQTMVTDDMVSRKAGVLIAKIKQPGSFVNSIMQALAGIKRNLVQEAQTNNVLQITPDEGIETLNLQNLDGASSQARKHILENIAADVRRGVRRGHRGRPPCGAIRRGIPQAHEPNLCILRRDRSLARVEPGILQGGAGGLRRVPLDDLRAGVLPVDQQLHHGVAQLTQGTAQRGDQGR
jgi:hypothetical protein